MEVLQKDNEDNAEVAIKYLIDIQKFYKTVCDAIVRNQL